MGWFSRKSEQSAAEQSLVGLQQPEEDYGAGFGLGINVCVVDTPEDRSPGSALKVFNEGDRVRRGDHVLLRTFGRDQQTSIASITVAGAAAKALDFDAWGEVTLGPEADLTDVWRTASLHEPDAITGGDRLSFLQVRTVEQRGKDVWVTGPAIGAFRKGHSLLLEPTIADDPVRRSKVRLVEPQPDGTLGLLFRADAAGIRYGDELVHVETSQLASR